MQTLAQLLPSAEMGTAHKLSSMDIYYTVATKQATYHFVVSHRYQLARVTKLIRKGHAGHDMSTTMSVGQARKFVKQLQAR